MTDRYRLARWIASENTGALFLLTERRMAVTTRTSHRSWNAGTVPDAARQALRFGRYRRHLVRRLKGRRPTLPVPSGSPYSQ
jgi:hypothetical protein